MTSVDDSQGIAKKLEQWIENICNVK